MDPSQIPTASPHFIDQCKHNNLSTVGRNNTDITVNIRIAKQQLHYLHHLGCFRAVGKTPL